MHSAADIIRMIRWAEHVARFGETINYTKFLSENLKGRNHLEDVGVTGKTILKWILKKYGVEWIHLAQDKDQMWDLTNMIINLKRLGIYFQLRDP
jgi:hypothetical protein